MSADPNVIERLRAVAEAAEIEINDEGLRAIAPTVLAMLARPSGVAPRDLGETEPAFGLRMRRE